MYACFRRFHAGFGFRKVSVHVSAMSAPLGWKSTV